MAAFTQILCADGHTVGNAGAAKVLRVDRKRIIMWFRDEEKLISKINASHKLSKAEQVRTGGTALTADIEEALDDYISKQRKQHRGFGSKEAMNKLLELKPLADASHREAGEGVDFQRQIQMLVPTFPQEARVQHPPAYQRGPKATHRTRGHGVGDVDEAVQGSHGARW